MFRRTTTRDVEIGGVPIAKGDKVVGAVAIKRKSTTILVVAEHGFGKRSELEEYRVSHRGGKGVFTMRATDKTGPMMAIREVLDNDDVVVVTSKGVVIRQPAKEIRVAGRNTQGVRLIRLEAGDRVSAVAAVPSEDEKIEEGAAVVEAAPKKMVPVKDQEKDQGTLFEETKPEGKKGKAAKKEEKAAGKKKKKKK